MQMSWQTETDRLVCRWSDVGKHVQYNPRWMQDASRVHPRSVAPAFLNFTRLSPFGGRRWFDPNRGYGSETDTQ
jgi:hypothetical protein